MKKFVALLLAVLMVASLCACGQKDTQTGSDIKTVTAGKLTMSTNAQFPPYESVADDGKGYEGTGFEGIDIEIAYALAQKLGLELVVDDMDFDSALSAVQTGKSDIVAAGVTVTPERQNTMSFTDSYANGVQVVIVKEGSDIKSIDDLEGKKIGTQRGTTGYSYCTDDYGEDSVVAFDDGATAVQNLLAGKVDCVVIDKAPARGVCQGKRRSDHSGHRVRQRELRHRSGQGQHRAAGSPEQGAGRAPGGRHHPVHHRQVYPQQVIAKFISMQRAANCRPLRVERKRYLHG